jgi:hypothetical protein
MWLARRYPRQTSNGIRERSPWRPVSLAGFGALAYEGRAKRDGSDFGKMARVANCLSGQYWTCPVICPLSPSDIDGAQLSRYPSGTRRCCQCAGQHDESARSPSFGRGRFYRFFIGNSKFFAADSESNQQGDQQVAEALGTAVFPARQLAQRLGFRGVDRLGQPYKRFVQVASHKRGRESLFVRDLAWTAAWPERGLQAEAPGRCLLPFGAAKRTVAKHGTTHRIQFGLRLRRVDAFRPVARPGNRPSRQQPARFGTPELVSPQARPTPRFRLRHQPGTQSIALDLSHHRVEMLVVFHRKSLETTLIQVAGAGGMVMRVPPHRVRVG